MTDTAATEGVLPRELGEALVDLAWSAIRERVSGEGESPSIPDSLTDELAAPGATFVTLTMNDCLRGCIGSLEAHRPLVDDVQANAVAAATRDPRFMPVTEADLPNIHVSVSLLTPAQPLPYDGTEAGAIAAVTPGRDGIILRDGNRRATFLPQVWDDVPDPADFFQHLRAKAGLDPHTWTAVIELERYEVKAWPAK